MTSTCDWLAILGIFSTIVVGIIGFYIGYAAKRPKLQIAGGGSGSNPVGERDLMLTSVEVYNNPSFLGLPLNRDPAIITDARIYDPELEELVGYQLLWGVEDSQNLASSCTIEAGRQKRLYLFAKDRHDDEFFIYYAKDLKSDPPRSPARYTSKKKVFGLWMREINGRQYKFPLVARNGDQSVGVNSQLNLRQRAQLLLWRVWLPCQR